MLGRMQAGDPQQLGRFRLQGRLGSGGMGQVYLGRSADGQPAAVKVVRPDLAGDPEFRARFQREVSAARQVSGRHTVQVLDADVTGPVPWLATAYIAGPSLATAVTRHGPLPVASVLALAAGLAEGLAGIHAAGMVHRDLKPGNVLLAADRPWLIDFGISRAAEETSLTQTGLVVGSPGYLSPEQAEGRQFSPASDVFSLGAVITFAAIGEGPFGTGTSAALLYRVVHSQPFLNRLDTSLRPLVEHCLAKHPERRPAPADLMAELAAARPSAEGAGWLPVAVSRELGSYQPPAPVPASEEETVAGVLPPPLPAVPAGSRGGWLRRSLAAAVESAQPGGQSPRSRRRDLAWLGVTSGLAAAAVAVMIVPGSPGRSLVAQPPADGATVLQSPPGSSSPAGHRAAVRNGVPQVPPPGSTGPGLPGLSPSVVEPGSPASSASSASPASPGRHRRTSPSPAPTTPKPKPKPTRDPSPVPTPTPTVTPTPSVSVSAVPSVSISSGPSAPATPPAA